MKTSPEVIAIAGQIRARLAASTTDIPSLRLVRREFSRQIAAVEPRQVVQLGLELLRRDSSVKRYFAYELVSCHRGAMAALTMEDLLKLGEGIGSWSSVDCFAMYLTGPVWARGGVSAAIVREWAQSKDRWWRRTALVSTVTLSRRGTPEDVKSVLGICRALVTDRNDMVVKALSWALRELAKKHPEVVRGFLVEHESAIAARVVREVNNKLRTGLKSGRIRAKGFMQSDTEATFR